MGKDCSKVTEQADPTLQAWVRQRLRFGKADDTIIVFIPSHDRKKKRLPNQDIWASEALDLFGSLYGGATGFPSLVGIWRDDELGGELLEDQPIMIQSLAKRNDVEDEAKLVLLAKFCQRLGKETNQGAVAVVINDAIHYISKYD